MAEKKKTMTMKIGVRYKGSAVLNEFGHYEFTPYQITGKQGSPRFTIIEGASDEEPIQLKKSKDKVRVVLTVDRLQVAKDRENEFREIFIKALQKLKEYDI